MICVDDNVEYWIESDNEINEDIKDFSHIPPTNVSLDDETTESASSRLITR